MYFIELLLTGIRDFLLYHRGAYSLRNLLQRFKMHVY